MTNTSSPTASAPVTFEFDAPGRDLESLKRSIANKLMFVVGKDLGSLRYCAGESVWDLAMRSLFQ